MLIKSKLKPVPKTNALRNDSGQGISSIFVIGGGRSFNIP